MTLIGVLDYCVIAISFYYVAHKQEIKVCISIVEMCDVLFYRKTLLEQHCQSVHVQYMYRRSALFQKVRVHMGTPENFAAGAHSSLGEAISRHVVEELAELLVRRVLPERPDENPDL